MTFFRTQTGITALCKSEDKLDLWSLKGKSVERRVGTGEAVLEEFQDRFVTELGGQVSEDILVLPAGYSSDELIEGLFRMNAEGTAENAEGTRMPAERRFFLLFRRFCRDVRRRSFQRRILGSSRPEIHCSSRGNCRQTSGKRQMCS